MRAEILPIAGLTARQRDAWRDLAERACVPNPFNEPDFVEPAVSGLEAARVGVLAVIDGSQWRAALPVQRVRRWRHVPGPLLVAWRHIYCFLLTPLVDDVDPEASLATLLTRGVAEPHVLGLMLDYIDAAGPIATALQADLPRAHRPLPIETFERAALERRPQNDYLDDTVGVKHRREMRRLRRRLEDEIGPVQTRDRAGDAAAVTRFLELERSGWKGRAGTAMINNDGHRRFFTEMCARFAAADRLQLMALESGDTTAAMKCNVIARHAIYCFKIAFDDRLARFSPGIHMEVANVDNFHEHTHARWMDSCALPDNAMINRLWPDRRSLQSVLMCPAASRGAVGSAIWRAARSVHSAKNRERTLDAA